MATYSRNKEIKTDTIALVQRATAKRNLAERRARELEERNNRARSYSASVSRKRRDIKENLTMVLAPIGIATVGYAMFYVAMNIISMIGGMM